MIYYKQYGKKKKIGTMLANESEQNKENIERQEENM